MGVMLYTRSLDTAVVRLNGGESSSPRCVLGWKGEGLNVGAPGRLREKGGNGEEQER